MDVINNCLVSNKCLDHNKVAQIKYKNKIYANEHQNKGFYDHKKRIISILYYAQWSLINK